MSESLSRTPYLNLTIKNDNKLPLALKKITSRLASDHHQPYDIPTDKLANEVQF